ncbi:MAG: hypothetical protein ABWJ42_06805 [Sulfolobales archaeon]
MFSNRAVSRFILVLLLISILHYTLIFESNSATSRNSLLILKAENPEGFTSLSNLYTARVLYSDMQVYKALALDNRILVLAGVRSSDNIVRVIEFSIDLSRYTYRDYIIHGEVTYIATSSSSESRFIVIGTKLGEIDIIDLESGQITYIQASRYPIERVFIGSVNNVYYILAYDGVYIYAYKYAEPKWLEIGPVASSALAGFYPASIIDVSPMIRVSSSVITYDISRLLLLYTPPRVRFVINITDQRGYPIDSAIVTMTYLNNPDIYYKTVSTNGSAMLYIPVLDVNGSYYELRITHPLYQNYTQVILVTRPRYADETRSIHIVMIEGRGFSETLEEVPPKSFIAVLKIDLSSVPYRVIQIASLTIPANIYKAYLYEVAESSFPFRYLATMFSSDGFYISYYDADLRIIKIDSLDYISYYVNIEDLANTRSIVSSDGSIIIFSADSKIYLFSYDPVLKRHIASSAYVFNDRVNDISLSSHNILSVTSRDQKLHLFTLSNYLFKPCTRTGEYSGYNSGSNLFYTYISRDSRYSVFVSSDKIILLDASKITSRCPIDRFQIKILPEIESVEKRYIEIIGELYVYEGDNAIAITSISNSTGLVYLPYSTYNMILESAQSGRSIFSNINLNISTTTIYLKTEVIPVDMILRVSVERSSFTLPPILAPAVGSIDIVNMEYNYTLTIPLSSNPLYIYLARGLYSVMLKYNDQIVGRGVIKVESPGILYTDLFVVTYKLNLALVSSIDQSSIDSNSVNMSLVMRGPLWSGYRFSITPGTTYVLPVGFYRVDINSTFYMSVSADIELFKDLNKTISLIPSLFDTTVILRDSLGRNVGKALIHLKNLRSGAEYNVISSDDGVAIVKDVTYDRYSITVEPIDRVRFKVSTREILINSTYITLYVDYVERNLIINMEDMISEKLISPINMKIYIDGILVYDRDLNLTYLNLSLPAGVFRLMITPTSASAKIYKPYELLMNFTNNTQLSIRLERILYKFRFEITDLFDSPINAIVEVNSVEKSDFRLSSMAYSGIYETMLPYGFYRVNIYSPNYINASLSIEPAQLINDTNIFRVQLSSVLIPVRVSLKDQVSLTVRGSFIVDVLIRGNTFSRINVNTSIFTVNVPKNYSITIRISPTTDNSYLYQVVSRDLGVVVSPLNVTIELYRKMYTVSLRVTNDLQQPVGAFIRMTNLENPSYSYDVSAIDGYGSVRVVAGSYTASIESNGYVTSELDLDVKGDLEKSIVLNPTISTFLMRFTALYIGVGVIIIVILLAMWLRRVIMKRLEEEII